MKRLPLSPRLRLVSLILLIPIALLFIPTRPSSTRPIFDPYAEEAEDGYRIHLSPQYTDNDDEGRWGVKIPSLDDLKGIGTGLGLPIKAKETILVTGGAGQLGQALLPHLSKYTVHILDIAPRPSTISSVNVVYHRGSATNPSTVKALFQSTSFNGVIHFAGVSLDSWCAAKQEQCERVNEQSVSEVMKQVSAIGASAGKSWRKVIVPWVIMGSSVDVYGHNPDADEYKPTTSLGKAMLKAEEAFMGAFKPEGYGDEVARRMRGMILRFSHVYGYAHSSAIEESFMPAMVRGALSSLPIQYDSDEAPYDLLHVDDAVRAILDSMRLVDGQHTLERVNIVAGRAYPAEEIMSLLRDATHSMSPVIDIGNHKASLVGVKHDYTHAEKVLGWAPSIPLPEGLQRTVTAVTEAQHGWVLEHLKDNCPASSLLPAGFTPRPHTADERNKPLHKLDRCLVNLHFDHDGFLHHMKCDDGQHCEANAVYVDGYNWNASYWIVHASKAGEGRAKMMFEEEKGTGWLGLPEGTRLGKEATWSLVEDDGFHVTTFDVEAAQGSSMLKMRLPGTHDQIHAVSNGTDQSTWFSVTQDTAFDMRMTVVCCPTEGEWPLLMDDHESADTRFGSTGQIPFNASRRTATCERAEQSYKHTRSLLQSFEVDLPRRELVDRAALQMSHLPFNWAIGQLPTCWNDCSSPMICVPTGSCRCVQAECPTRRGNPLNVLRAMERRKALTEGAHLDALVKETKVLVDDVARLDLSDVLLPAAREYLVKHPEFIKVFVLDAPDQAKIESAECHKLQDRHCFSADTIMYKGFRSVQVATAAEADLVILPAYQQCKGIEFLIHDLQGLARDTIPGVREGTKRVGVVLTHDWGICVQFAWEIWSARIKLQPQWIIDNTLVMSVMGDYDSPCYRPHQDVVVPARSCRSETLRETFPTIASIKAMRDRVNLMTWAGTYWGTGKNERLRLTCPRGGADEHELIEGMGKQDNWESWDYMNDLSNARFCPQPRGIAGWSPRTNDAIYAGCIPVLIAEGSHYPYATFLDWTKFSVRINPTDLDRIEQILAAIPLEKVEEMQANLALVREGFLYSSDEHPEEEKNRKGPMWFALHEAGMRLRMKYPSEGDKVFGEVRAKKEGLP